MVKLLFFVSLFLITESIAGQSLPVDSLRMDYNQMYGLDMLLYNGKKYFSEINPVQGHPFWGSTNDFKGDIYLNGKVFRNCRLKYNLVTQQFILSYTDSKTKEEHHPIILVGAFIDSIRTDHILFVRNQYPEIPQAYVQEIYSRKVSCFLSLYKEVFEKIKDYDIRKAISEEKKEYFIKVPSGVYPFQNTRTFLKIFPKQQQKSIKKYISSNKLSLKNIDDWNLKKLVIYCEKVLDE